jgi:hypothetical protein
MSSEERTKNNFKREGEAGEESLFVMMFPDKGNEASQSL